MFSDPLLMIIKAAAGNHLMAQTTTNQNYAVIGEPMAPGHTNTTWKEKESQVITKIQGNLDANHPLFGVLFAAVNNNTMTRKAVVDVAIVTREMAKSPNVVELVKNATGADTFNGTKYTDSTGTSAGWHNWRTSTTNDKEMMLQGAIERLTVFVQDICNLVVSELNAMPTGRLHATYLRRYLAMDGSIGAGLESAANIPEVPGGLNMGGSKVVRTFTTQCYMGTLFSSCEAGSNVRVGALDMPVFSRISAFQLPFVTNNAQDEGIEEESD